MTKIHFYIHYITTGEEHIGIEYCNGNNTDGDLKILNCHTYGDGHWMGQIELDVNSQLRYRYAVVKGETIVFENEDYRNTLIRNNCDQLFLRDQWKNKYDPSKIFLSSAFTEVIFKPENHNTPLIASSDSGSGNKIVFQLLAPDIPSSTTVGITGCSSSLGEWKKAIPLDSTDYPLWKQEIKVQEQQLEFEFKYVLCDPSSGEIISWEGGQNRRCNFNFPDKKSNCILYTHEGFRHANYRWRGAGVAIPVFSMRSKRGLGIGEFRDLKELIDLTVAMEMDVVQILPVNDTIAAKTYKDSYPYSAISVFALHPLYINIDEVGAFKKKSDINAFQKERKRLNKLDHVDIVEVIKVKLKFLRILYDGQKKGVFRTKAYKEFYKKNKEWLVPYAAFCHLRDLYGTADFNKWKSHNPYNAKAIKKLSEKGTKANDDISFYCFLQFHADKQLKEVKEYGRDKRVVLKGDLPIGVYRYSCDAWMAPELYNMDGQSGAPPDDYAENGQNWGFPTYNWERMAEDNFLWWRQRMKSLATYFDALRIDHILGFFRIWEIPIEQISGIMGKFNPRLPLSVDELENYGIRGDLSRYIQPYIGENVLIDLFGVDREFVKKEFLLEDGDSVFRLKPNVSTQSAIKERFTLKKYQKFLHLQDPLSKLVGEVLLLEEIGSGGTAFNPRISMHKTFAYKALSGEERRRWDALYNDYFYSRHNDFWRNQALWKLPALLGATDMLICGEDLGMIPGSVPGVMKDLHIISLEIQRMPKGPSQFGIPAQYDYMTVCSPSCHDMSTIRGWWESDHKIAQQFYNHHMHREGYAPEECSVEMVKYINQEHLNSASVFAIFPIQDLLGMDKALRKEDAASEQINDPSNSNHYWKYRLHIDIEDLLKEKSFIESVKSMVLKSGR